MLTIPSVWLQLRAVEVTNMNTKKEAKKRGRPAKVVEEIIVELPEVFMSNPLTWKIKVVEEIIVELPEAPLRAMIVGVCNNPTWLKARIDGFSVNVKCPAQISKRLLGKEVDVMLVNSDLEDYYQYIP